MRILIVSYNFPPSPVARSLQLGKLIKYLTSLGVQVDAVSAEVKTKGAGDGKDDLLSSCTNLTVARTAFLERNVVDLMGSKLCSLPFYRWSNMATDLTDHLVASKGRGYYDCLMTCAHPMDSHRVGLKIKAKYPELPWMAHFSDPWATNPMAKPIGPWQLPLMRRFERKVIEKADRAIFVCRSLCDFVMQSYPKHTAKGRVLHHVFDPVMYGNRTPENDGKVKIVYAGGFDKLRNIQPFLKVLQTLKGRNAPVERFHMVFVGDETKEAVEQINQVQPGIAFCVGRVGYKESLEYMEKADCLLLINANLAASPYFPSKLCDYFGARRPVLAITPRHSCSTELLREMDMPSFDYDELERCADYLEGVLNGTGQLPDVSKDLVDRYAAPVVARQFIELVEDLVKNG